MTESREYYPSSPRLRQFIHSFWTLKADSQPEELCLVAPEPYLDCLFSFKSDTTPLNRCGEGSLVKGSMLLGLRTQPFRLLPQGEVDYLVIRFYPSGLRPFLGFSCRDLTDNFMELNSLREKLSEIAAPLEQSSATDRERIDFIEKALLKMLPKAPTLPSKALIYSLKSIKGSQGLLTISELCRESGIQSRRLNREFENYLGVSPKRYSKIVRFSHLLERLTPLNKPENLASIAYDQGYYDQAHMIKECTQYTGLTPSELIKSGTL